MSTKVMIIRFVLALIFVFGIIGAILFWMADPLYLKAPPDSKLIRIFNNHRDAFESLRRMIVEDSQSYVSASHLDERLSDKRRAEYRNLISEIGAESIAPTSMSAVRFVFTGGGLSAIGPEWFKGIEYAPEDSDRGGIVIGSLDQPRDLAEGKVYLRQIGPHWYLFLQKTD